MTTSSFQPPPDEHGRVLFRSDGISVMDLQCRRRGTLESEVEPNPRHSIVFIRRGVFRRFYRDQAVVADSNHVLFFNAAEPYRYSHPVDGGDDCTILAVETGRALELVARHAPRDAQRPETPFSQGHGLCSPRAARLQWELMSLLGRRPVASLVLEDLLNDLADAAVGGVYGSPAVGIPRDSVSSGTRLRRRDLVEAAMVEVSACLDVPPSLTDLAGRLGCSPFHLSRTFHNIAGLSLRHYVKRLRARAAAERLAAGADDLTGLALDLGYADHSHFTNSFRQEWGLPPSRFRAGLLVTGMTGTTGIPGTPAGRATTCKPDAKTPK